MQQIRRCENQQEWDEIIRSHHGHPLQLWGWGEVKARHGWKADRVIIEEGSQVVGAAQLLIKRLPKPFKALVYIPRGPVGLASASHEVRRAIEDYCRQTYHPISITAEPDSTGTLDWKGWIQTKNRILLARTAIMDLTMSEDELQGLMSKKTRQYIRKSAGEGIVVTLAQTVADIDECLCIYKQTAARAGFSLHEDAYYHDIFKELGDDSPVFMAQHEGHTVAFLWPIVTPEVAFELYGGMTEEGQSLRANYHLKWNVIQAMKQRGVNRYDVNGLLNDGVTAFKKGFIPEETMMAGTFDKPLSPLYSIWASLLPAAKRFAQRIRR